ncbi:hypothetical protein [Sphingobium sp. YC-XJ3]|uniref:hypothetical protein n=1 Tax=Sphingobium sp. YC-XJ3 TaxID=3024245 RepID=UPI002362F259|nr:hypothetical protein [Sphingobium sp. YC-XJ3]WDA37866.1 hypothetical protein PO876_06705 [Sphingobium sp. YC-XJ3]
MGLFGSLIGAATSIIGGNAQKKAANKAADAQVKAAQLAIDEQRRQFDITQQNFAPYLGAGTSALGQIGALLGISSPGQTDWAAYVQGNPDALANWNAIRGTQSDTFGGDIAAFGKYHYDKDGARRDLSPYTSGGSNGIAGQQAAIDALKASPLYTSLYRNGEDALLSAASATGGLRGGNTQGALYNLGADTLAGVIQQQLSNLGGIANMGMGSAGQLGQFGANTANQVGNSLTQQGQARAGSALARGGITSGIWNNVGSSIGDIYKQLVPNGINLGGGIKI